MKNFLAKLSLVAALGLLCLAAPAVHADSGTPVTPTMSRPDGCTWAHAAAASGSQTTLTLTPNAGQYVYIQNVELTSAADGTGAAEVQLAWTSTNLGGFSYIYSKAATADLNLSQTYNFGPSPLKSVAAGTAVTIVSSAGLSHQQYSVNACWYSAP